MMVVEPRYQYGKASRLKIFSHGVEWWDGDRSYGTNCWLRKVGFYYLVVSITAGVSDEMPGKISERMS